MRGLRGFAVLAIVAALWGAPQSVSAAANELASPQVSPGSGEATTTFTFRVRYEGAFEATAVSVTVAGLTVAMALESGTHTAGWWRGSRQLPIGAWSTAYRASVAKGPAPTLAGPIVVVASAAPSAAPGQPSGPSSGATPAAAVDGVDGPAVSPATTSPAEAAGTDASGASPAPPPGPDPAPAGSGAPGAAGDGGGNGPVPGGGGGGGSAAGDGGTGPAAGSGDGDPPSPDGAVAAPTRASPSTDVDPALVQPAAEADEVSEDRARGHDVVSGFLLAGLAGVASVAIAGTLLLASGRRREPERATALAPSAATDEALRRRVARSGRAQTADDPIVAALGVDDEMAARRAIRRAGRKIDDEVSPETRPRGR